MPPETYDILLALLSGMDPKSLNTTQDMLSTVFDPQYGVSGSTFDTSYTLPAPYTPNTPRLDAYMNSSNPIFRDVASGIQTGALDEASAVAALYNGLGYTYDTEVKQGLSVGDLRSAVKEMFDEKERDIAARIKYDQDLLKSEQENVYGKAGLPQPYQEWTPDTMPISQDLRAYLSRLQEPPSQQGSAKLAKVNLLRKVLGVGEKVGSQSASDKKNAPNSKEKNGWVGTSSESAFPMDGKPAWDKGQDGWVGTSAKSAFPNNGGPAFPTDGKPAWDKGQDGWIGVSGKSAFPTDGGPAFPAVDKDSPFAKKDKKTLPADQKSVDFMKKAILNLLVDVPTLFSKDASVEDPAMKAYLQAKAIGDLRMAGEKIGLQMQGQTPLSEALRRRALGLGGM